MSKCPKCKEELEYVHYSVSLFESGTFDNNNGYEKDDYPECDNEDSWKYRCPNCNHILARGIKGEQKISKLLQRS